MEKLLKIFDLQMADVYMIPVGVLLFVLYWRGMSKWFFAPLTQLISAREAATSGAQDSAQEVIERADKLEAEYHHKLNQARVEAIKAKLAALDSAKKEAMKIAEKAELEAQEIIRKVRWDSAEQISAWRTEAFSQTDEIVQFVINKINQPKSKITNTTN